MPSCTGSYRRSFPADQSLRKLSQPFYSTEHQPDLGAVLHLYPAISCALDHHSDQQSNTNPISPSPRKAFGSLPVATTTTLAFVSRPGKEKLLERRIAHGWEVESPCPTEVYAPGRERLLQSSRASCESILWFPITVFLQG